MLTDIFAERYASRVLWENFTETESKLLVQCFRIVEEQLIPYWVNGKESPTAKAQWKSLHDRLSMELGLDELAPRYYSYPTTWMGTSHTQSGFFTYDTVCKNFVCAQYTGAISPDRFMKERISFIELAFRLRTEELATRNLELAKMTEAAKVQDSLIGGRRVIPGTLGDKRALAREMRTHIDSLSTAFKASVDELNERLKRARTQLNYHNGFIQVANDPLVEEQIERPFWKAVANPLWENVDIDIKEALNRRDVNDRDPAFYAARALESTIKIISDQKGWTHGGEKGAHNYIDNLGSKKNGEFINDWESKALKPTFKESG